MSQQSPNLGSIYRRRSDGKWVAALSIGGRRVVRYAKTKRAAQDHLRDLQVEYATGTLALPGKTTLAQFLDTWLQTVAPDLKPSALARYDQLTRHYLRPHLGHLKLHQIEPMHVLAAIAEWRKKASPGTVNAAYRALHRALRLAVRWGLLARNPADAVERPNPRYRLATVWTAQDAQTFLASAQDDRWYAVWLFLAGSGARLGEALGLEWADIDWDHQTVSISRSLVWVGSRPILETPKTRAGYRALTLPASVMEALRHWRSTQAAERLRAGATWRDQRDSVFTTSSGSPPSPPNMRRSFRRRCELAGVPACRLHDMRHFAATALVAAGVDPKVVQGRLGHATLAMTLGLYSHRVAAGDQAAALALERALGGPSECEPQSAQDAP